MFSWYNTTLFFSFQGDHGVIISLLASIVVNSFGPCVILDDME